MHYFLLALFYFSYKTIILDIGSKTLSSPIVQLLDKKVTNIVLNANSSLTLEGKCGLNVFCFKFPIEGFFCKPRAAGIVDASYRDKYAYYLMWV